LGLAVCATSAAFAFQQQEGATAPAQQPSDAQAPAQPSADKPLGLSDETTPKSEGTEVRIPGLGKLGVLPKMDFGLELLYGAADQKQPEGPPQGAPNPDEDLMIRGTVKHRF
jgi:hypothetical protein